MDNVGVQIDGKRLLADGNRLLIDGTRLLVDGNGDLADGIGDVGESSAVVADGIRIPANGSGGVIVCVATKIESVDTNLCCIDTVRRGIARFARGAACGTSGSVSANE